MQLFAPASLADMVKKLAESNVSIDVSEALAEVSKILTAAASITAFTPAAPFLPLAVGGVSLIGAILKMFRAVTMSKPLTEKRFTVRVRRAYKDEVLTYVARTNSDATVVLVNNALHALPVMPAPADLCTFSALDDSQFMKYGWLELGAHDPFLTVVQSSGEDVKVDISGVLHVVEM